MQHDMVILRFTNNPNTKVSYIPVTSVSCRQHNRLILRLRSKQIMKVSYIPVTSVNIMQHISLSQSSQKPQTIQTLLSTITSPTDACTTCVHLSKIGIFVSSHFQTTFVNWINKFGSYSNGLGAKLLWRWITWCVIFECTSHTYSVLEGSCFETNVQWPWYILWHRKKYSRD